MKRTGFSQVLSSMDERRKENNGLRLVPVEIADYAAVNAEGPQTARVTLMTNMDDYTAEEIAAAFSKRMDRKARVVDGSMMQLASVRGRNFYTALVVKNTESLPYADNHKKFKLVASSTFLDDNEQIWTVVGDGDTKRLVLNTQEDLSKVLASRKRHTNTPEHASVGAINGHYAMYYSPVSGKMEFGFPVVTKKGVVVASRDADADIAIDPLLIVASEPLKDHKIFENPHVELSATGATKVLEYFRKLFKDTTFFVNWEAAIRRSAGVR